MKRLFIVLLIILCIPVSSFGADVYCSRTGDDSTGMGSISSPFKTIQVGINALKVQGPGNTLYLRGGTYTEIPYQDIDGTLSRGIKFTALTDSTSWENAYTIRSYPGEWAVIDAAGYNDDRVFVLAGTTVSGQMGWVEISHLEIKNAYGATHCAAIDTRGGPYRFRYLYIHDNSCAIPNNNPAGLHLTNGTGLTDIAFNIFLRNGCLTSTSENGSNIAIYSDYIETWGTQSLTTGSGKSTSRHANSIRYNLIDGGGVTAVGIKQKGRQYLENNTYFEGPIVDVNGWSDKGSSHHHNIVIGHTLNGMYLQSDFDYVYNNIINGSESPTYSAIQIGPTPDEGRPPSDTAIYNNTIKNSNRGLVYNYVSDDYPVFYNRIYNYNNILDTSTDASNYRDVNFMLLYDPLITWDINTLCQFKNNLFYNPDNAIFFRILTVDGSYYNQSPWAINNLSKPYSESDYLYVGATGANAYKLNPAYTDYVSVSTGGIGGQHPYLDGVTMPSYIGAVNPADDDWVDGVMAMDVAFFTSATGDPSWIEGAEAPIYDTPTITGPDDFNTTASSVEIEGAYGVDPDLADQSVVVTWTLGESSGFAVAALGVFSCTVPGELGTNSVVFEITDSNSGTGSDTTVVTRTPPPSSGNVIYTGSMSGGTYR